MKHLTHIYWNNKAWISHIINLLITLKLKVVKRIYDMIQNKKLQYINHHIRNIAYDVCKYKLFYHNKPGEKNKANSYQMSKIKLKIKYDNRIVEALNINTITNMKHIKDTVPKFVETKKPTVIYKYGNPIRNKIFNYADTLRKFDYDNYANMACDCGNNTMYCNGDLKHIVTGDLNIIPCPKLRKIFT